MGQCAFTRQCGRTFILAAAAFGLGYLAGAKGPTPQLTRADPASSDTIQADAARAFPAAAVGPATRPANVTGATEPGTTEPRAILSTEPVVETGPTPYALVGLHNQLMTVRSALALYALQHLDTYPTLAQLQRNWSVLTSRTDLHGDAVLSPLGGWGPYLDAPPVNAVMRSSKIARASEAGADTGWTYDPRSGQINPVLPSGVRWGKLERLGAEIAPSVTAAAE